MSLVAQTPNSVATITSFLSFGLNSAHLTGMSGKLPSLLTHEVPPLLEYQIEV